MQTAKHINALFRQTCGQENGPKQCGAHLHTIKMAVCGLLEDQFDTYRHMFSEEHHERLDRVIHAVETRFEENDPEVMANCHEDATLLSCAVDEELRLSRHNLGHVSGKHEAPTYMQCQAAANMLSATCKLTTTYSTTSVANMATRAEAQDVRDAVYHIAQAQGAAEAARACERNTYEGDLRLTYEDILYVREQNFEQKLEQMECELRAVHRQEIKPEHEQEQGYEGDTLTR